MVCKFKFWAPFNLNSWGLRPEAKWQMVCGRDDGFLQSTVRVQGERFILYDRAWDLNFKIYSKFILNSDFKCRWLMCLCFIGEEKQQNLISRRSSSSSAAVVAVVRCHIPAACGYNAPRHNDARLRPIKLTQNYIDDIFWARKFHGVRANGLDKISVALNNIWCGVVMTIAANM